MVFLAFLYFALIVAALRFLNSVNTPYEDRNEHEQLGHDPLLALLAGKREVEEALAGRSTLNRMELTPAASAAASHRYRKITYSSEPLDALLVDIFLEAHLAAPAQIVFDLDVTDTPLHGEQEARFFHGYYGEHCYLPRYIFCGDHLLCARQRASNQDASAGALAEGERIVNQIRRQWPQVPIILRADSGFCREPLMAWCEAQHVDYVFGLARNQRLEAEVAASMAQAQSQHEQTQQPARLFAQFADPTRSRWSRPRRVVAKAEYLDQGPKLRFVVTSLAAEAWPQQATV